MDVSPLSRFPKNLSGNALISIGEILSQYALKWAIFAPPTFSPCLHSAPLSQFPIYKKNTKFEVLVYRSLSNIPASCATKPNIKSATD